MIRPVGSSFEAVKVVDTCGGGRRCRNVEGQRDPSRIWAPRPVNIERHGEVEISLLVGVDGDSQPERGVVDHAGQGLARGHHLARRNQQFIDASRDRRRDIERYRSTF